MNDETKPDTRARLLYDLLECVGPLGQSFRAEQGAWLRDKGAELFDLYRRGERLGVLREERP